MRKGITWFILLLLVTGCKQRDKIPADILPPDRMEKIMWDMIRADEFVTGYIISRDSTKNKKAESIALYEKVFLLHKTNKEEFHRSFSWYRSQPIHFRMISDSLHKHMSSSIFQPSEPSYSPDSINKRVRLEEQ